MHCLSAKIQNYLKWYLLILYNGTFKDNSCINSFQRQRINCIPRYLRPGNLSNKVVFITPAGSSTNGEIIWIGLLAGAWQEWVVSGGTNCVADYLGFGYDWSRIEVGWHNCWSRATHSIFSLFYHFHGPVYHFTVI